MYRWIGVVAIVVCTFGVASADGGSAAIPAGADWYCFALKSMYPGGPRTSVCRRAEGTCNEHRNTITPDAVSEVSECVQQAKAAVVTYFDVMKDQWQSWAAASSEDCAQLRRFLAESRDHKQISGCQLVGAVYPAPAAFKAPLVPPGRDWFCATDGDRACSRSSCIEGQSCAKQSKASAFTSTEAGTPNAWSFRTSSDCERARRAVVFTDDEVSACAPIGATAIAVPPGVGWYCYRVGDNAAEGGCHREEDACARMKTYDEHNRQLHPEACIKTAEAFGFVRDGDYDVVGSEAMCKARMSATGIHGRCERLK